MFAVAVIFICMQLFYVSMCVLCISIIEISFGLVVYLLSEIDYCFCMRILDFHLYALCIWYQNVKETCRNVVQMRELVLTDLSSLKKLSMIFIH